VSELTKTRQSTHGDFSETARVSQAIKQALETGPNWHCVTRTEREALAMIAAKLARIVCGDPHFIDHWNDIAGYAELASSE
jgi:Domain of unknown function (DUF6378)